MKSSALLLLAASACASAARNSSRPKSGPKLPDTVGNLHLLNATAQDISESLASGDVTSVELVNAYLARIEAHNAKGVSLHAVIETAPTENVLAIAEDMDNERVWGNIRSPLHGVPILVKDSFDTDPELGMHTTAGSYVLLNSGGQTIGDAFVVKKLRDAGAIIIGKANLDEWSGISGVKAPAWSPRGGRSKSPYVKDVPSSGSGVGVAAGFAPLVLGSDTEGGVLWPAGRNALFGLRPSTGVTSRIGLIPVSTTQDSPGLLAKSVWDLAHSFDIIAAFDEEDPAARPPRVSQPNGRNSSGFLDPDGFEGLKIGILKEPFIEKETKRDKAIIEAFDEATDKFKSFGAKVVEISLPNADQWNYTFVGDPEQLSDAAIVVQYDLKADIAEYLQTRRLNTSVESLADIMNKKIEYWSQESPEGQCCFPTFISANELGDRETSAEYWQAKRSQERLFEEGPAVVFEEHDFDVLVHPTDFHASRLAAVGGLPAGTVPLGYDGNGLPFGLTFTGKRYDEATILRAMSAFEAQFPPRKLPKVLL